MGNCGKINGIMMVYLPGIFTYIWVMFEANVGNYSIHGAYGNNKRDNYSMDWFKGNFTGRSHI